MFYYDVKVSMKENSVYKENLTFTQKVNYEILLKGIKECRESIRIMETNIDTLNMIIEAIRKDNTSLYYVGTFRYSISTRYSMISPQYLYQKEDISRFNKDIHSICEQLNKLATGKTEWEKVLYIHDWLCEQIRYSDNGHESHTVIGALINHNAVCEGIAKAVKLLFDFIGIDSCVVSGKANSIANNYQSENHAWNKVKVNKRWYNIDVTFDNTLSSNTSIRHDYFLLSDNSIQNDHTELSDSKIICDNDELNYYVVKRLVMNTQQSFLDYFKKSVLTGVKSIEFKLPSTKDANTVHQTALQELKLYKQIDVIYNQKQLVFTVIIH